MGLSSRLGTGPKFMSNTNVWWSVRVFGSIIPTTNSNVRLKTQLWPVFQHSHDSGYLSSEGVIRQFRI